MQLNFITELVASSNDFTKNAAPSSSDLSQAVVRLNTTAAGPATPSVELRFSTLRSLVDLLLLRYAPAEGMHALLMPVLQECRESRAGADDVKDSKFAWDRPLPTTPLCAALRRFVDLLLEKCALDAMSALSQVGSFFLMCSVFFSQLRTLLSGIRCLHQYHGAKFGIAMSCSVAGSAVWACPSLHNVAGTSINFFLFVV